MDDIDKVQNSESVDGTFVHAAHLKGEISCPCVFTVPLTYGTSSYVRVVLPYQPIYRLPAIALLNTDGTRRDGGFDFMHEIFKRRMPFNPLTSDQIELVFRYSGGVLVDAMRMLGAVCRQAIAQGEKTVGDDAVENAFQQLVDDYNIVFNSDDLWVKLAELCKSADKQSYMIEGSKLELLGRMVLIEYREDRMWFDVHPAARRLYEQNKDVLSSLISK